MDVLRTAPRDTEAARRLLQQALRRPGLPELLTIDGSDANAAAIQRDTEAHGTAIAIRQVKYGHTIVAQEPRGGKRVPRPMVGVKSCTAAQDTRVGIELKPMSKKRQLGGEEGDEGRTAAALCYSLAA